MLKQTSWVLLIPFLLACSKNKTQLKAEYKTITESVYASVNLVPKNYYKVSSAQGGIIDKMFVSVGDTVEEGMEIVKIKDDKVDISQDNSRLNYEIVQSKTNQTSGTIAQFQKKIEIAYLQLENDSVNFKRQENLWKNKIGSKAEYEAKKMKYDLSKNNYKQLISELELIKKELNNQLKIALNNWQINLSQKKDYVIKSNLSGLVYDVFKKQGEWVNVNEAIAIIGNKDWFVVEMNIDEKEISKIKTKQKVIITLKAYPNQIFEANISKIHPKINAQTQTFLVEAEFSKAYSNLYMGLSGEANIVIGQTKKGLVIPKNWIVNNQVYTDNGWVDIKQGIGNLFEVEVLKGIDTNTVILPLPKK